MLGIVQLFAKALHVTREKLLHPGVDMFVLVADNAHQLANDLRICLAIETVIGRAGLAEDLDERSMNRAPSCAIRPEQRSVNVKQYEPRGSRCLAGRTLSGRDHERVRRSPLMIDIAPAICHGVIDSPSNSQATARANMGCRFEYIAVRVGPSTRTPL